MPDRLDQLLPLNKLVQGPGVYQHPSLDSSQSADREVNWCGHLDRLQACCKMALKPPTRCSWAKPWPRAVMAK